MESNTRILKFKREKAAKRSSTNRDRIERRSGIRIETAYKNAWQQKAINNAAAGIIPKAVVYLRSRQNFILAQY
nr:hypothetical protein [Aequorivita sp. S2608]